GKTGTVGRNALEPETAGKPVIAEVVAGIAGSRDGEQDKLAERERRQPGKQRVGDAPGPRRDPACHPGQPCPRHVPVVRHPAVPVSDGPPSPTFTAEFGHNVRQSWRFQGKGRAGATKRAATVSRGGPMP